MPEVVCRLVPILAPTESWGGVAAGENRAST
jgi:hypothetical protein